MRTIYSLLIGIILCPAFNLHAAATLWPAQPVPADTVVSVVADAQGLSLVPPDQVPPFGTFWMVTPGVGGAYPAPLPCPPFDPGLPIYAIADGQFLVDATGGSQPTFVPPQAGHLTATTTSATVLEVEAGAIIDLITQIQAATANAQMRMLARAMGMNDLGPSGEASGDGNGEGDSPAYTGVTIDTNALWLEITNVSNGWSYLNLHNATNQVYAIWTTTNLSMPFSEWQVETEVWPTTDQTNVLPFKLPILSQPTRFYRAEDWTGVTENGNTTPCWWFWLYFGTTALMDATLDSGGVNTLVYDYTNRFDPNVITFSFSFPNQYVFTSTVSGAVTILGGVPSTIAILVDNTNFPGATWNGFTSSNITVNLGSSQGPHDIWVGLRGLPANAQQTWEETTLVLDSSSPSISITNPVNNVSFNSSRVDVSGNFTANSLKQITVNGILAFVHGTNFDALNVPLDAGANSITAVVEDLTGSTNVSSINVNTTTNADGSLNNPVQLQATPVAGFSPLPVAFQIQASLPGTVQQVACDFNGDDIADFLTNSLDSITNTYTTNGEYFPVVTIQTTAGRFSSMGGWNAVALDATNVPIRINVQVSPTVATFANITDPVDLKWDGTNLYVLSRSTATLTEFGTSGNTLRSLSGLGTNPTGLDVDAAGNVYVAMNGANQVWRFHPTNTTFAADPGFGTNGYIGNGDASSGTGTNQFNAPFDVAVSADGTQIAVSDSGNNRIQMFDTTGHFINSFGSQGTAAGQLNSPKGLAYDSVSTLYVEDSANNRIVVARGDQVLGVSGTNGAVLGQFNTPVNISVGERGVYVADTGNNRIQSFDLVGNGVYTFAPAAVRFAVVTNFNGPYAVAAVNNLTNELFYVADTGNNRVALCMAPNQDATALQALWNHMTGRVAAGDIPGAISDFSISSADDYRQTFLNIGTSGVVSDINQVGALTPVFVNSDTAEYYFNQVIDGQTITFPVDFTKENGVWKIQEF